VKLQFSAVTVAVAGSAGPVTTSMAATVTFTLQFVRVRPQPLSAITRGDVVLDSMVQLSRVTEATEGTPELQRNLPLRYRLERVFPSAAAVQVMFPVI